jgi:heme oxygenase
MEKSLLIPVLDLLRSATWHRHEAFERLPFVTALKDGSLPLTSYIGQLRGLAVIFSALEQALAHSDATVISLVTPLLKSRFDMLCADLAHFSPRLVPDILPAVRDSLDIAGKIRATSCTSPNKLIGYLYVLQGTTKGNRVHLPDIIRCFNLKDQEGTSFYCGFGDDTDVRWEEFRSVMNSVGEEAVQDALQGTAEIYDALERFHEALYPLSDGDKGFTATALNPEAGDHPVPQNPAILQAAIRAGRRCRDEFSYFEKRYGERGRRFTDSDAAWLAALADQPVSVVADQVQWLGRVLSVRGMPVLLMERQLELLLEEFETLEECIPVEGFQAVVADMRQLRYSMITQARFDETVRMVKALISSPCALDFPDLPLMLAAAHLDTLAGLPECMASLVSWLRETSLLTDAEIEAVRKSLAELSRHA